MKALDVDPLTILVTGGAGFIGSHLCDRLIALGHHVVCLDNLLTGSRDNIAHLEGHPRFSFVEHDVQEPIPDARYDQIYNLACPASPPQYQRDPVATMRTCVYGANNVLELARRHAARAFQASTSEVYGDPDVHPQPEEYFGSVNCASLRACYDEGKRAAESLFYDYNRHYGVEIRVARIFNTYGPRMSPEDGRVIPNFISQALTGRPLSVYGVGSQTRSFCFIDDTVEGLIRLMNAPGSRVGAINIGNPTEFTIRELADLVLARTASESPIDFLPLPADDPKIRQPDIEKARSILGWTPRIGLLQGLDTTIGWYEAVIPGAMRHAPATVPELTVAVIGGGPAGLTAAYELQKHSTRFRPVVLEASTQLGGIARTEQYKGYRFDIGGHRFFTKVGEVEALWREVLGDQFVTRPRMSRIYYRGKFYHYPLKIFNALGNIGPVEATRILGSYVYRRMRPNPVEDNFEQWVVNRFGQRLYAHFFQSYTEKVWGIPCTEIRADWAAQRIKNLSLKTAVLNALTGTNDTSSLIEQFEYPPLGPGMMWDAFGERVVAQGGDVRMQQAVTRVIHHDNHVDAVEVVDYADAAAPRTYRLDADHVISSMALVDLIACMDPPPPAAVVEAGKQLKYRDFLIVVLILDKPDPFPDNWIYVHSSHVKVGRIQNFRSWSEAMVPDPGRASIGMEYFCHEGDGLWQSDDADLIAQATQELASLGLATAGDVVDGTVIRQPKAYPVYDGAYRGAVDTISAWVQGFDNFQTVGRNGMHRYNNQDHSMLTAMLAARIVAGEQHDIWNVNVERSYHEEFTVEPKLQAAE